MAFWSADANNSDMLVVVGKHVVITRILLSPVTVVERSVQENAGRFQPCHIATLTKCCGVQDTGLKHDIWRGERVFELQLDRVRLIHRYGRERQQIG
jgi:hypothetical protein